MIITTRRLSLRPLEREDAAFLADLVNDPDVRGSLGAYDLIYPVSVESEQRWIDEANASSSQMNFVICLQDRSKPIGLLSVKEMNGRNASGHLSIILKKSEWDKGYGEESIKTIMKVMFDRSNMHRIWLRVDERNARAIRCYEKCGFRSEGVLREDHYADGAWRCSLIMAILSEEYRGRGN